MKSFLLSALLLLAAASASTIRSGSRDASAKAYLVTAPKIFLGEESVCLTLFDEQSIPRDAVLRVQLASTDGETLHLLEQPLQSGE